MWSQGVDREAIDNGRQRLPETRAVSGGEEVGHGPREVGGSLRREGRGWGRAPARGADVGGGNGE